MKKSIRCCISCILPCGALDIIRIVHVNGKVEEITGTIKASQIMKAHPKHVLKKPSSSSSSSSSSSFADQGYNCQKTVVVPPDVQLQRGKIYFLVPLPPEKRVNIHGSKSRRKRQVVAAAIAVAAQRRRRINNVSETDFVGSDDQYVSEILSEKLLSERDRRRGRAGVWRPHLESISETPAEP